MEALKIYWQKRAIAQNNKIAAWYEVKMGFKVASKYFDGIVDTINTLVSVQFPRLAIFD